MKICINMAAQSTGMRVLETAIAIEIMMYFRVMVDVISPRLRTMLVFQKLLIGEIRNALNVA